MWWAQSSFVQYMSDAIRIFFLTLTIGLFIDRLFQIRSQGVTDTKKRFLLGLEQFFVIISVAFVWNWFSSHKMSIDFQVSSSAILMSSFLFNLQETMVKNFKAAAFHDL